MTEAHSDSMIANRVVATAKRIEAMDSAQELDPLEVRVEAGLDGTAYEFTAVLGVGGPYIAVNVTNGTVEGQWGGDSYKTHVDNDAVLGELDRRYHRHWEDVTIA